MYRGDSSVSKRAAAQKEAFEALCALEHRGFDVSVYLGKIADVVLYRNK